MHMNVVPKELTPGGPTAAHRGRLLSAMAQALTEQGYAAVTIADVVRLAGVSRRTFYEHFDGKQACFIALYRAVSGSALRTLRESIDVSQPWQSQLEHALGAYLNHLAAGPALLRSLFIEIHHLGETGALLRRETMQALADFMGETIQRQETRCPGAGQGHCFDPLMAMAAVGAIHELVLTAIERDEAALLGELTPVAVRIVSALAREHQSGA
jgi:AcrR family transcriptional regulator